MNNLRALNVLTILSNYINNLFNELIPTYLQEPIKDYDDYLTKIINCANETLKISTESKAKEITLIKENLKKEGLTIKDTIIIRNIVLNYLSNYLHQEKEKIRMVPSKSDSFGAPSFLFRKERFYVIFSQKSTYFCKKDKKVLFYLVLWRFWCTFAPSLYS